MGIDLRLLPVDGDHASALFYSHMILECFRRSQLFEEIMVIQGGFGKPVPDAFYSFVSTLEDGEYGYGITKEDSYGDKLTYVLAQHLKPFRDHEGVKDNPINRAIWAFIEALPNDFKIVLCWH